MAEPLSAYYLPVAVPEGADPGYEYFQPTDATTSVWASTIQHGGPPTGLLVRAMEKAVGGPSAPDGMAFSRVTMDILGGIGHGVNRVRTTIARPGRQISQVAAELSEQLPDGTFRVVGRTTAWRLLVRDSASITRSPRRPLRPAPADLVTAVGFPSDGDATPWGTVGFIGTVEAAPVDGRTGTMPALWVRPTIPLVAGEQTSDLASAFIVIDVANGVGSDLSPAEWSWMNTDTTVHLIRAPRGPWVGLDAVLAAGPDGYGATLGDLYDAEGFIGRSAQTVLLAPAQHGTA